MVTLFVIYGIQFNGVFAIDSVHNWIQWEEDICTSQENNKTLQENIQWDVYNLIGYMGAVQFRDRTLGPSNARAKCPVSELAATISVALMGIKYSD